MNETSQPVELLLAVAKGTGRTLGGQIEDQLRVAIRAGTVKPGSRVPSTRDLSRQLGVSRRVVVDAYAQLAAEGYLELRQGANPRVSDAVSITPGAERPLSPRALPPRFDFRPSVPDVSTFPRHDWLRSLREAVLAISDADLQYGDVAGVGALRDALAGYLGRVRAVVADAERIVVTNGYTQGLALVCRALAGSGATRIALEDPANPEQREIVLRAGLEPIAIPVDDRGIRVELLDRAAPDAVVITPAHQHPTGAVLSRERRAALLAWLREHGALAVEDDYDAEYRYDGPAVGSLQGLEPDGVVYAGSTSKTLAPALRLGWLVVPPPLLERVRHEKLIADQGSARIEQQAFAHFLERGHLDRHLRRMRVQYRARRDALVGELARSLPEGRVRGIAAGLHVAVELPEGYDESAIAAEASRRRIALNVFGDYREEGAPGPAGLIVGYGQASEPAIRAGVPELAAAVRAARV